MIGSFVVKKPHVSPYHVRELINAIWQFHSLYSSATERWVQASTCLITGNEDQGNEKAIWVEQHVSDLRKRSRSSSMIQASFNMTVRYYCYRWIFLYEYKVVGCASVLRLLINWTDAAFTDYVYLEFNDINSRLCHCLRHQRSINLMQHLLIITI